MEYLGVRLSKHLGFDDHIIYIRKSYQNIGILRKAHQNCGPQNHSTSIQAFSPAASDLLRPVIHDTTVQQIEIDPQKCMQDHTLGY